MAKQGLTREVKPGPANAAGETLGLLGPMVAAAKAPQVAAGLLKMGENAAIPRQLNPQTGAIVYHGSPHKFDKFDSSKIGTGEGAQAYGHGLYLAESPTVATGYKETLAQRVKDRLTIDGKVVDPNSMLGRAAEDIPRIGLQATLQKIDDNIKFNDKYAPDMAEMYRGIREKIASLDPSRVVVKEGQLYKVDLPDEHIAKMLDWDKPLSQQAPEVQNALSELGLGGSSAWDEITGLNLFAQVGQRSGGKDISKSASEALRAKGIPGIRYLDGGSRGAGQGTSNYVVFPGNEDLLTILERNGVKLK
jgi:hypothetical protein